MSADVQSAEAALARTLILNHPMIAARLLETATAAAVVEALQDESAHVIARAFSSLSPDAATRILVALSDHRASAVLGHLEPNRAASLLARLPAAERDHLTSFLPAALREELRELQEYGFDSAGGMMDPRVTILRPDDTVEDAIRLLRTFQGKRIQDVFLCDTEGRWLGSVPIQEIIVSEPDTRLSLLVDEPPQPVAATTPREEVVRQLATNPQGSLPVVDFHGRVVGVLRQPELLRAAQRDGAANALTMVGASKDERALSSFTFSVRKRLPWLMVNLLTAFLAALVVGIFEDTIARFTALAVLLPVVAGQSGNTGAQALAVTMRGLALREVRTRQWFNVALKEILAGATNGVAIALTTGGAVWLWSGSRGLGFVIALSMVLSMTIAGLAGALIPMVLTTLRQDPAQSSSIVLTTVTDVAGFLSFLGIATVLASLL